VEDELEDLEESDAAVAVGIHLVERALRQVQD
jgi:hypothetical protein